jgi:hypothetical protein
MPGAWGLSAVPAEGHLDVDQAIALAKKVNVGTTADTEYFQLRSLLTGSKEIEALLVMAQFGEGLPGVDSQTVPNTLSPMSSPIDHVEPIFTHNEESTQLAPDSNVENVLPVMPCSVCGGRGRLERQAERPKFLARLLGAEQVIETCTECNGTGAAGVS